MTVVHISRGVHARGGDRVYPEGIGCKLMLCLLIVHGVLKGLCGGGGMAGLIGAPAEFPNLECLICQMLPRSIL